MATYTPNINLRLPSGTENISRSVLNSNFTAIDTAIGAVPSGSNLMNEKSILTSPNGTKYRLKVSNDGTLSTEVIS